MENTPKGERRISIRFPLDVLAVIRALAKQHERSFTGEVIWALGVAKREQHAIPVRQSFHDLWGTAPKSLVAVVKPICACLAYSIRSGS
jgi:hypothetical protein